MDNLTLFLTIISVVLLIFALIREVICWYFKINQHLENQQKIISELKNLNSIELNKNNDSKGKHLIGNLES